MREAEGRIPYELVVDFLPTPVPLPQSVSVCTWRRARACVVLTPSRLFVRVRVVRWVAEQRVNAVGTGRCAYPVDKRNRLIA